MCTLLFYITSEEVKKDNTEKFAWKPEPLPKFTRDPDTKKIDLERSVDGIEKLDQMLEKIIRY